MSFSERNNIAQAGPLQDQFMTPELRNALWNPIYIALWDKKTAIFRKLPLVKDIWVLVMELPFEELDEESFMGAHLSLQKIKKVYKKISWSFVYDILEVIVTNTAESFKDMINSILYRHNSAYRLQNEKIIRVVDPALLTMIDHIYDNSPETMKAELNKAITKLSERGEIKNPYIYNDSARDAIHILEAYLRDKTGKSSATLGDLINLLKKDKKIEKTFGEALHKLYGFASDQLRHSSKDDTQQIQLEYSDALYILHLCLALVNYLECPGKLFQSVDNLGVSNGV